MSRNQKRKTLSWRSWTAIIAFNTGVFVVFGLIFRMLNVLAPFGKALIPTIGIFIFNVIIVSNVKRQKPWSRWSMGSKE